ncbi:hypothetical protein C2E23DRAFT_725049, partial [Lenzites betulinus]
LMVSVVNCAILPSLWPNGLGRVSPRLRDLQVRDSWRFVPEEYDDLYDWATVIDDEAESADGCLVKHLVYDHTMLPQGGGDALYEVTVLLQGFMGDHALGVLGNWRGEERDAPQAQQFLKLQSGGVEDAFSAQRRALQNILMVVHTQTGGEPRMDEDENSITLRRTVFTKVRPTGQRNSVVELNDINDPFKAARRMSSRWCIDHTIDTCVRRPNGTNIPVSPDAIRRGDFIEVAVTAHIRTVVSRKRRQTIVDFAMHEVVRLWSAREAKVSVIRTSEPTYSYCVVQEKYTRTDTAGVDAGRDRRAPVVMRAGRLPEEVGQLDVVGGEDNEYMEN